MKMMRHQLRKRSSKRKKMEEVASAAERIVAPSNGQAHAEEISMLDKHVPMMHVE